MKIKHILVLMIAVATLTAASAQAQTQKEKIDKIMARYKESSKVFMNFETCGSLFDGPAYLAKRAENRTLDRIVTITPEQEADLGAQMFHNSQEQNVVNSPKGMEMLNRIISRLSAQSTNPDMVYHPYILNSDQINAYSTIGGYIYVTTALFKFVGSEDELAFVVGHEMGHILNKHCVRKTKKIALIANLGEKYNYQQYANVALNAALSISAPFDQMDEYEADQAGFDMVKGSGYDKMGFDTFFASLEKYDSKDRFARFKSTHPSSARRRKCLNNQIQK